MRQLSFREIKPDAGQDRINIKENRHPITLVLDRLEIPANIGMILRLADAARIERVIFYQMEDVLASSKVSRVARNAEQWVVVESISNLEDLRKALLSHQIVALEYTDESIDYRHFTKVKEKLAFVVGNEKHGVSESLLSFCESSIHIPMFGVNSSMNVAMATGIVVYGAIGAIGADGVG